MKNLLSLREPQPEDETFFLAAMCQCITLAVETGNIPSIKLYKSFGFKAW